MRCPAFQGMCGLLALTMLTGLSAGGEPIIKRYSDYNAYRLQVESIAKSKYAALQSLGTTLGRRNVYLLKLGTGRVDDKPAVLVLGSVEPAHLVGSELATRMARRLVEQAKTDGSVRKLLGRVTFYVIPRPAPDACEAFFQRPYAERSTNQRPTDDDGDGRTNEDGPDDLNGDGRITMMRVEDPAGGYIQHPDDARLLIKADAKLHEHGRWAVYVEGRDNDRDERQNEDPAGGVAFNRNFTFEYPYFKPGAGPHQVSEVESRAVADFAFSRPNIAMVLTFTPEDNLMRPWKPSADDKSKKIKTSVYSADAPYLTDLAEQYQKLYGAKNPPESPKGAGSASGWAYFHYGRWSLGCRAWWPPEVKAKEEKVKPKEKAKAKDADKKPAEAKKESKPKPSEKKRAVHDLNALAWFEREKIAGFVDWKPVKHPDFPGRKVEVGGFVPFLRLNPPADQLAPLADKHLKFLRLAADRLPSLSIERVKAEPLGEGVYRVTAVVVNRGKLPTVSEMGRKSRQLNPLQVELKLPKGLSLVTGHARVKLPPLAACGGEAERSWLVLAPKAPARLELRAWSPAVGSAAASVTLREK